ncbi:MAG: coagulation factor 5/8 type domain protein [Labilithrix sp.]|nr:coagulation factor 5/8 type domain protein [Labilithrix sp.]
MTNPQARRSSAFVLLTIVLGTSSILGSTGCLSAPDAALPPAAGETTSHVSSEVEGENLAGVNLAGVNLSGTNLSGTNLAGVNLAGTNLAGVNLAGTNLAGTNLAGTNLAGTNLAGTNLAGTNLAGTNLAGTNLAGTNLAGTNLAGTNLAGADVGSDIHDSGAGGLLYSGEDVLEPASARSIVFGISGTVLPSFLARQSADARISVSLGKLPWGFASVAGGPVTTDAWEALVWGDKGYTVFILGAPPGTAWSGVAGFLKALFRWNAPPSQSMDIIGTQASAAVDPTVHTTVATYTGMMGAAAAFTSGSVTTDNFLAGELALVTATTNSRSVMVDFSSWVRDASGRGRVLANVEDVDVPRYAESAYSAYRTSDGTLGVSVSPTPVGGDFLISASDELGVSYAAYRSGLAPKPIPTRCPAALFLNAKFGEPVPADQCDSGITWLEGPAPTGATTWASVSGTTAPMNAYQSIPSSTSPFVRTAGQPIGAEVYTFLWEPNHALPASAVGGSTGTNRAALGAAFASVASCSGSDSATAAFDPTSTSGWCVSGVTTTTAPRSLGYAWGASVPITSYRVTSTADTAASDPKSWTFQGCDASCAIGTDVGWTTLDTRPNEAFSGRSQTKTYPIANTAAYSQYRLRVTAVSKPASTMQIRLLELLDGGGAIVPLPGVDRTENGIVTWTGKACSAGELATRAFDNLLAGPSATRWCVSAPPTSARPIAVAYQLPAAATVSSYRVTSSSDNASRDPKDWTLEGCNGTCRVGDDDGWVQVDSRKAETFKQRLQTNTYAVASKGSYAYYRLKVTANNGDKTGFQLGELQLF